MIRRVALDLATEHRLEELTVEAIAEGADISPRTFFNYFSHKEDALVTDAAAAATALHPEIIARPADESPLHAIRAMITEHDLFTLMNTDRDRTLARQKLVQQHPDPHLAPAGPACADGAGAQRCGRRPAGHGPGGGSAPRAHRRCGGSHPPHRDTAMDCKRRDEAERSVRVRVRHARAGPPLAHAVRRRSLRRRSLRRRCVRRRCVRRGIVRRGAAQGGELA